MTALEYIKAAALANLSPTKVLERLEANGHKPGEVKELATSVASEFSVFGQVQASATAIECLDNANVWHYLEAGVNATVKEENRAATMEALRRDIAGILVVATNASGWGAALGKKDKAKGPSIAGY